MSIQNVVLISIDSLRADALGCCGGTASSTPNIDQLASKGNLFKNAIVQAPYTVSSHASMLTGFYPFNHGLRKRFTKFKLPKKSLHILRKVKEEHKLLSFVRAKLFGPFYGYDIWDFQGRANILTIKNALNRHRYRPFFAFIHYWGVHTPYATNLAESLWELLGEQLEKLVKNDYIYVPRPGLGWLHKILFGGDRRKIEKIRSAMRSHNEILIEKVKEGYRNAVKRADRFVGQILESLESSGLLNKTTIILTADHGESFNEFNEVAEFPNAYEHGPILYDTVIRVPLIITDFSSSLPGGKTIEQQVQTIDIMPTILDIYGKGQYLSPKNVNGISLLNYINRDKEEDNANCSYAYSETMMDSKATKESIVEKACIRADDGYKLIFDYKKGNGKLVNYRVSEKEDIKEKELDIYRKLKVELTNLIEKSKIELYSNQDTMSKEEYDTIAKRLKELGYVD